MIKCVMRNIFYSLFKEVSVLQIRSVTFKIHQNGQNYNELLIDLTIYRIKAIDYYKIKNEPIKYLNLMRIIEKLM